MKDFLNKYGLIILLVVVLFVNIWKENTPPELPSVKGVKNALAEENLKLNVALQQSRDRETRLLADIQGKEEIIRALDSRLSTATGDYEALKAKLACVPPPEEPASFLELQECREKYAGLVTGLNLCLAAGEKGDEALHLCLEKTEQQEALLGLQESTYNETQQRLQWTEIKLQDTETAMQKLEDIYQRKLFKKDILKYTVGLVAGVAVGYFVLKRK